MCALHVMSRRAGAFHKKHGQLIRLLEEDTVAHRIDSYNKAVVFTEQPIAQGSMFQVKLQNKSGGWDESIVSPFRYTYSNKNTDLFPPPCVLPPLLGYRSLDSLILVLKMDRFRQMH